MKRIMGKLKYASASLSASVMLMFVQVLKNVMTAARKAVAYAAAQMASTTRLASRHSRRSVHSPDELASLTTDCERRRGVRQHTGRKRHEGTWHGTSAGHVCMCGNAGSYTDGGQT